MTRAMCAWGLTRLGRVRCDAAAPRPSADGVEGLDLDLVMGPGVQPLQRGLAAAAAAACPLVPLPPHRLRLLQLLLPHAVHPAHTQPVAHRVRAAVVLVVQEGLRRHREGERES